MVIFRHLNIRRTHNIANIIGPRFAIFIYDKARKPKSSIIYNNRVYIYLIEKHAKKIVKAIYPLFNIIVPKTNNIVT